jgi:hypothetical protein
MKPKNLLVYYGWLNSFNSSSNQWNNEKVAQELAKYDLLVFGDGIQTSSHGDYSNTQVIIPRIKELNPNALIFGYVTVNQTLANFKTKADDWETLEVDGIFLDEAGYDYGKTRAEFNERCMHVKNLAHASRCFANAWNINHVLGTENDSSYPNTTYNADGYESLLDENDFYLLESFAVNTDSYTSNNGYASKTDWKARGEAAQEKRNEYEVSMVACNIIADSDNDGQDRFDFCHRAAQMYDLDGNGSSDSNYGASSAASKFWTRPTPAVLNNEEEDYTEVTQDTGDADVYLRYSGRTILKLDWSNNNQTSSATQY